MRDVYRTAFEALNAAVEHAQETSELIKRSEEREKLTVQLVAKSRERLRRSRARLSAMPGHSVD